MGKTVTKFALGSTELNRAIREVERYKAEFKKKWTTLMERLTEDGAEIAKAKVVQLDAVMFGDLVASIEGFYDPSTGIGIIRAGAPHAVFVEYGTGVAGMRDTHPEPTPGRRYDSNNHGEAGWWYWGDWDSNWHWTKGMPSRPFMFDTKIEMPALVAKLQKEVFS